MNRRLYDQDAPGAAPGRATGDSGRFTRDSISDVWGPRTPYVEAWPERQDERVLQEPDQWSVFHRL
jgi:hypothetical protein